MRGYFEDRLLSCAMFTGQTFFYNPCGLHPEYCLALPAMSCRQDSIYQPPTLRVSTLSGYAAYGIFRRQKLVCPSRRDCPPERARGTLCLPSLCRAKGLPAFHASDLLFLSSAHAIVKSNQQGFARRASRPVAPATCPEQRERLALYLPSRYRATPAPLAEGLPSGRSKNVVLRYHPGIGWGQLVDSRIRHWQPLA
jgi:hypothetical protein